MHFDGWMDNALVVGNILPAFSALSAIVHSTILPDDSER